MQATDAEPLIERAAGNRSYEPNDVLWRPVRSHDHVRKRALNLGGKLASDDAVDIGRSAEPGLQPVSLLVEPASDHPNSPKMTLKASLYEERNFNHICTHVFQLLEDQGMHHRVHRAPEFAVLPKMLAQVGRSYGPPRSQQLGKASLDGVRLKHRSRNFIC